MPRKTHWIVGLLIVAAALAPASLARGPQAGRCISADVGSPIVLPDGSRHSAGSLEICMSRIHSPVASLHETRIDGHHVGIYVAQSAPNEEYAKGLEPYMVFGRSVAGDLVLRGYVVPDGKRMRAFRMGTFSETPVQGQESRLIPKR
jgi:hypothetical protein